MLAKAFKALLGFEIGIQSSVSFALADAINLTKIKTRETFSYVDSSNSSWVYYQFAETELTDGTYVEFLVADWGNNTEATGYPEFRVFAVTKANEDIKFL